MILKKPTTQHQPMAKRPNQNPRRKKTDDYDDDRTIIKISPSKQEKEPTSSRRTETTAPKNTRSKTSRSSTSKQSRTKSKPSNQESTRSETPNKNKSRSAPRKTNSKPSTRKSSATDTKKATSKKAESKTSVQTPPVPVVQKTVSPPSIHTTEGVKISQSVAILIDGNNIEISLTKLMKNKSAVLNFDIVIPKLLHGRGLNRLIYFREGRSISKKLADRLHTHYFGSVVPCHKSADIPLSIQATQLAEKVDTIIILSGDSDYVELVRHVKSKGVRVEIAAIEITTASILIEEADYYSPITAEDAFIVK